MDALTRRGVLALAGAALAAGCSPPKPTFHGVDITGAEYARKLALTDAEGRLRTLADFKGKVAVIFFGFTQCPDVCPTTLAELAEVKRALGPRGDQLQGVFVSVDPERDTPQLLKSYVGSFDPSFVALRGTAEQTQTVVKEFKLYVAKVPTRDGSSYTVDHTAASYVFDKQGRPRLYVRYGGGAKPLTEDIVKLLDEAG